MPTETDPVTVTTDLVMEGVVVVPVDMEHEEEDMLHEEDGAADGTFTVIVPSRGEEVVEVVVIDGPEEAIVWDPMSTDDQQKRGGEEEVTFGCLTISSS